MKYVRIIDENGFFICDDFVDELTEFTVEAPCPDGFYRPRWNGEAWVEGATQEEIDAMRSALPEPTAEERLEALEAAMLEMLLGGVI